MLKCSVMVLSLILAACDAAPTATASAASSPAPSIAPLPSPTVAPPAAASSGVPLAAPTPTAPAFGRGSVTIQTKSGPVTVPVEIAGNEAQREYGLMNRSSLPPNAGMLFVFQPAADAKQVGFWMKDTVIPLSVAFVEPNMAVESIQDMQPQTQDVHYAPRDYAYAIEANVGFFANHGVAVGDKVTIQGA